MGHEIGGAILAVPDRTQGAPRPDAGWISRPFPGAIVGGSDYRRRREDVRVRDRRACPWRRDRELVRVCAGPALFLVFRPQGLFGEKIIERV